ncbi:MAG: M28 family peptidase [Gaiellaceae bacterium]
MRPKPPRIKPRPGSLERPVNARIYRGSWVVVAIPLLIAAFSVARGQPLSAPSLRPVFGEVAAQQTMDELVNTYADRSPGAASSASLLAWVEGKFADYGLTPKVDRFSADIPGLGKQSLANVSVTIHGRSPSSIVILAHRDNSGQGPSGGPDDNASGTAAMLELARAYQKNSELVAPPEPAHTIIFLSTDGGAFGAIGADHFARHSGSRGHIAAVIVLDAIAGKGPLRILLNGDAPRSPSPVLVATAFQLLSEQPGAKVTHAGFVDQVLDLAFPFSLYEQAPFVARGIPAITFTTGGDRPPLPLSDTSANISGEHLSVIGLATEQLIAALDQGAPEPQTNSAGYVYLGGRFVHGWALQLVLIAALLPPLVAIVDLFARCRRRQIPLEPSLRSLGRRLGFWLFVLSLFLLFVFFGLFHGGVARPLSPDIPASVSPPFGALVLFAFFAFGAWLIARERLLPHHQTSAEDELAGYAAALLLLLVTALVVASLNRYMVLFLLPPLHAWIWLPQLRDWRPWASLGVMFIGLLGPLLVFFELASRLHLGLKVFWYVTELGAVGYLGLPLLLVAVAFTAASAQLAALSVRRYAPYPAIGERPDATLPQLALRRFAPLSRRWDGFRAARRSRG